MRINTLIIISFILIGTFVLSFGFFLGNFSEKQIKNDTLKRLTFETEQTVKTQVKNHINEDSFKLKKISDFKNLLNNLQNEEIINIKIWDMDGTILFSLEESLIGNNFNTNPEFQKAIKGEVVSDISKLTKPENIYEKKYGELIEIYIPVYYNSKIVGVIETYRTLDNINNLINTNNDKIKSFILFYSFILLILIGLILLYIRKVFLNPLNKMTIAIDRISDGKFDTKFETEYKIKEIHDLAKALSKISASMKLAILKYKK